MSFIAGYIAGLEEADLKAKAIEANGRYYAATDDDCDGYSMVEVDVRTKLYEQPVITENGIYLVPELFDGFGDITVNVPKEATLAIPPTFTENGTYYAADYDADGFKYVDINVPTGGGGGTVITTEGFEAILGLTEIASYNDGTYTFSMRYGDVGGVCFTPSFYSDGSLSSFNIGQNLFTVCSKDGADLWAQNCGHTPLKQWQYNNSGLLRYNEFTGIDVKRSTANSCSGNLEFICREGTLEYTDTTSFVYSFRHIWDVNYPIYTNSSSDILLETYLDLKQTYTY